YQGKAFPAHIGLPIRPEHFERWLDLFAEAARAELPAEQVAAALDKAQHMAKSFMAGLFPLETPRMQALSARLMVALPEAQSPAPRRS
ncbi:hypothetical protein MXD81_20245, partial [Microbacteriaceae bacterium K1510]|nr:hypothetical protein [Microbacteriaceae bacterium K1510]